MAPQFAAATLYEESSSTKVQLDGYDYLHLYVGNAYQAMHFLRTMFDSRRSHTQALRQACATIFYVLGQGTHPANCSSPVDHSSPWRMKSGPMVMR
jgi:phytoene dehydrogenase-like protein